MSDQPTPRSIGQLIRDPPKLHKAGDRLTSQWKLEDADLLYLDQVLRPGMRTLETGAGVSTIAFALKGTKHTCVVPDQSLVDRIIAFCSESGIRYDDINFVVDQSEYALPRLTVHDYDFALIDGRHGFPAPFIDCCYIARLLKIGGAVMIDDLHIWTADILVQDLRSDESWRIVRETWRTATFAKRADDALTGEWTGQRFVVKRSLSKSLPAKIRLVLRMLRTRDLTPVRRMLGM